MRDSVTQKKNPHAKIYDDGEWVYYEFTNCLSPREPRWHDSARRLMTSDREDFCKNMCEPFKIATPPDGIVQSDGTVLSWFSPMQRGDLPPYADATWMKPAMDTVMDQNKALDQRSILYGYYDESLRTFFFNPEDTTADQVLLIFQNTVTSPVFVTFAEKWNGKHIANTGLLEVGRTDEFIILDVEKAEEALCIRNYVREKKVTSPLVRRLHDNIVQHEKYNETLRKRVSSRTVSSEEQIAEARQLLEEIRKIGDELVDIDPDLGFIILDTDEWFSINGRKYSYTTNATEYLGRIIKIAQEKPFSEMVPLQLRQVRSQMDTCLMNLKWFSENETFD